MSHVSPSLFSRLLTALGALACASTALWIGYVLLEPVPVPPAPPAKAHVRFDTKVDVSQRPTFQRLEPLGFSDISLDGLGRLNPFAPVPVPVIATSTAPTSTVTSGSRVAPLPLPPAPVVNGG